MSLQSAYLINEFMRYIFGFVCDEEIGEIMWSWITFVMFEVGIIEECLQTYGEVEVE